MFRLVTVSIVFVVLGTSAFADSWPQFRGVNATGVSAQSENLPVQFSYQEKVRWSVPLGNGIACPVVADERLVATAMVEEERFAVICLNSKNGEEIWRREFETKNLPTIMPPNTQASSTPVIDGDRVYVYFSTLGLLAFDLGDGNLVWQHSIPEAFYLLDWGPAHSPIVLDDMVIFCQDDDLAPFILALDKFTGEVRWRTERSEMLAGYSLPVVCTANGQTDIVVAGSGKLKGYDPKTGKQRWTCNTLLRTIMTTPAVRGDTIYVSVQSYGDTDRVLRFALLQWKDTNQDEKLAKAELDQAFWAKFAQGDKNKDGFLVGTEIDEAFQAPTNMVGGGNIIQAIRGGGQGDVTETHVVWKLDNKSPSNIASPLVAGDQLFVVKKGGISACFNAKDGAPIWEKKRIRNFGNYYASPIAGDGKIYVMGENGYVVVLEQGRKLKVLAKNDMGESCVATPAIANNSLYIRTLTKLYCIAEEIK